MGRLKVVGVFFVVAMAAGGCSDGGSEERSFTPESQQCLSASDMATLATLQAPMPDGGVGPLLLRTIQEVCARDVCFNELLGSQNPPVCLRECMDMMGMADLSPSCRDCHVFSTICAAENCAASCLAGSSEQCVDCSATHCVPTVDDCVGYVP